MRKLLELGDRYAHESNWKDFALTKFCLFSMGLAAGMSVPDKRKKGMYIVSAFVFVITYIPLMAKLIRIARREK